MGKEYMTVGSFNAEVLSHTLVLRLGGFLSGGGTILDPKTRISKRIIKNHMTAYEGKRVYFVRQRYVTYFLRSAMVKRSGNITETTTYIYESGEWVNKGKETENGVY